MFAPKLHSYALRLNYCFKEFFCPSSRLGMGANLSAPGGAPKPSPPYAHSRLCITLAMPMPSSLINSPSPKSTPLRVLLCFPILFNFQGPGRLFPALCRAKGFWSAPPPVLPPGAAPSSNYRGLFGVCQQLLRILFCFVTPARVCRKASHI